MKILGAGDNVVDRYVNLGVEFPGGNAVNVATFARRLGAQSSYMGVIGNDPSGQFLLNSLRREAVDVEYCRVAPGPNAFAEVEIVNRDRIFVNSQANVARELPTEEHFAVMSDFDVVHCGYAGTYGPYVAQMAERAKVSYDFGSEGKFDIESLEVRAMLPHLHLASFSGSHLDSEGAEDLASTALECGAANVLVTRGGAGAFFASRSLRVWQDAEDIDAVDSLGAGDAFISSVLVGLLSGRQVEDVLASAASHAAQVCMRYGAFGVGREYAPAKRSESDDANTTTMKAGNL